MMPMIEGSSNAVIRANVAEMIAAGHSPKQAVAAAYRNARTSSGIDAEANAAMFPAGVAFIYFWADGRILWLHRPDGSWSAPGGKIEDGETALEAVIRECREEIGTAPCGSVELLFSEGGANIFACECDEFTPILNAEHDGYLWATVDEVPELFPQADQSARLHFDSHATDLREYDTNGWFEVKDNPISKVGVFPYRGASVDPALPPDAFVNVYRPAEELCRPETLDSFRLIPWIDNHVMLGSEDDGLTPAERKGIQGVTGESISFDGTYLRANIKVLSESMASLIQAGKKELSAGYRCKYQRSPGVFEGVSYDYVQRDILGNHLALVGQGRMGPDVAVMDTDEGKDMDEKMGEEKPGEGEKEVKDEMTLEQAKEHLSKILPMIAEIQKMLAGGDAPADAPKDEMAPGEKPADAMDAAEIAKQVEAKIATKAALYDLASKRVGAFDHAEMTVEQIAAYACDKLEVKPVGDVVAFARGLLSAQVPAEIKPAAKKRGGTFVDRYLNRGV